jgi:hypothetical protein
MRPTNWCGTLTTRGFLCAGVFSFFFASTPGRGQGIITFDGPPLIPPGSAALIPQYFESDIWFRPLGPVDTNPPYRLGRRGGGSANFPENGTAYLNAGLGNSLVLSYLDDSPFDLWSVELAEYSTVVPNAVTVQIIGYRYDGVVVVTNITTDGVIDGTGPVADFEQFFFDDRFRNLQRVEIPTSGWSLDNLGISKSVPEPGRGLLLLGAVLAILYRAQSK